MCCDCSCRLIKMCCECTCILLKMCYDCACKLMKMCCDCACRLMKMCCDCACRLMKMCYDCMQMCYYCANRLKCRRCVNGIEVHGPPPDSDCSCDLSQWHHCVDRKTVPDVILKATWQTGAISFVYHHHSHEQQRIVV